ncbi:MAG: succinate dehydrogenase iron-sulfur subunit [Candidatus Aminicenantes bacterium]|nr:succinate dehydrogenase iron-sulfur subunit [Candidatus Aminicenantes bacterium]
MKHIFKILRYDPEKDEKPHFQEFIHEPGPADTVMEAMKDIRDQQDPTLSFRYSCREAICGSCAVVIIGHTTLACLQSVAALGTTEIVIEPLPNLEIQKDLYVDMDPFWEALEKIEPYIHNEGEVPENGHEIDEAEMDKIYQFISCILCACCYSACPVASRDGRYLGPAALAKLYRLVQDPRDQRDYTSWRKVNAEDGVWGCDTVFKCNEVCPKEVRPADGILALRRKIFVSELKHIFKRKP